MLRITFQLKDKILESIACDQNPWLLTDFLLQMDFEPLIECYLEQQTTEPITQNLPVTIELKDEQNGTIHLFSKLSLSQVFKNLYSPFSRNTESFQSFLESPAFDQQSESASKSMTRAEFIQKNTRQKNSSLEKKFIKNFLTDLNYQKLTSLISDEIPDLLPCLCGIPLTESDIPQDMFELYQNALHTV